MNVWILGCLLFVLLIISSIIIERIAINLLERRERFEKTKLKIDFEINRNQTRINTVSMIASSLIGNMLSNPRYLRLIESLQDNVDKYSMLNIGKEETLEEKKERKELLKMAEDTLYEASLFGKFREKYIELAWDIYYDVSKKGIEEKLEMLDSLVRKMTTTAEIQY